MLQLDPRIEKDSFFVTDLPFCQLRLQNDSRYPWFVLVPKVKNITEVHELTAEQQTQLILESSLVANCLKQLTGCKKVNVANLGNIVSQLHWHVVARTEQDEAWPGPIWGVGVATPWPEQKRADFIDSFLQLLVLDD